MRVVSVVVSRVFEAHCKRNCSRKNNAARDRSGLVAELALLARVAPVGILEECIDELRCARRARTAAVLKETIKTEGVSVDRRDRGLESREARVAGSGCIEECDV